MPLPRSIGLGIQSIERLACPRAIRVADVKVALIQIDRHRIWRVSLNLEGMRAGTRCCLDGLKGGSQRLVVVAGHLRDDEGCEVSSDVPLAYSDRLAHWSSNLFT